MLLLKSLYYWLTGGRYYLSVITNTTHKTCRLRTLNHTMRMLQVITEVYESYYSRSIMDEQCAFIVWDAVEEKMVESMGKDALKWKMNKHLNCHKLMNDQVDNVI